MPMFRMRAVMQAMLITNVREAVKLESAVSPPSLSVIYGVRLEMGAKLSSTRIWRISSEKGSIK